MHHAQQSYEQASRLKQREISNAPAVLSINGVEYVRKDCVARSSRGDHEKPAPRFDFGFNAVGRNARNGGLLYSNQFEEYQHLPFGTSSVR